MLCRHHRRREPGQSGQATVEFAIIIPLVVVVLLAVAQVAVIAYLQLAVTHLSHELARELAVDPSADLGRLTRERSQLRYDDLRIETQAVLTEPNGRMTVVVRVTHDAIPISGVFQPFLTDVTLSGEARMVAE